ncbi:MAG: MoaD/ThiS family protein [Deltaproteobacteria bacterium]|nr:MAG: MoaD/ThiS family protein [Deltaproteobacteria bacterium]
MAMIHVKVKLFATLRRFFPGYDPEKGIDLSLEKGSTVEDLIRTLQLPQNEARVIIINGLSKQMTDLVEDGDQVSVFTPLGGG